MFIFSRKTHFCFIFDDVLNKELGECLLYSSLHFLPPYFKWLYLNSSTHPLLKHKVLLETSCLMLENLKMFKNKIRTHTTHTPYVFVHPSYHWTEVIFWIKARRSTNTKETILYKKYIYYSSSTSSAVDRNKKEKYRRNSRFFLLLLILYAGSLYEVRWNYMWGISERSLISFAWRSAVCLCVCWCAAPHKNRPKGMFNSVFSCESTEMWCVPKKDLQKARMENSNIHSGETWCFFFLLLLPRRMYTWSSWRSTRRRALWSWQSGTRLGHFVQPTVYEYVAASCYSCCYSCSLLMIYTYHFLFIDREITHWTYNGVHACI